MRPIVINGTVLCDPITGIPRYVYEVVTRLDALLEGTGLDVRLAYRDDGRPLHLPPLKPLRQPNSRSKPRSPSMPKTFRLKSLPKPRRKPLSR